jgi:curved DNA-binding protein CbpA
MEDYYAILKVARNATKTEIRTAYLKLARECHPDRFFQKRKWILTNERFALINEAYKILFNENERRKYDEKLRQGRESVQEKTQKIQGENSFRNGLKELQQGNFEKAFEFFESAFKLNPSQPRYKSYGGLALARTGKRLKEALAYCNEATKQEVFNPDYYVNLGIVLCLSGNKERGKKQFQEALRWKPNHPRALQELAKVDQKKSWIKKIFKGE